MSFDNDVRWKQRFSNYQKALRQLKSFIDLPPRNEREEQGMIKAFEYTFDLGWNTMKDFFEQQGDVSILGSRDAIRLAYNRGLITNGNDWMLMVDSRIKTAHTYNQTKAKEVIYEIQNCYLHLFNQLEQALSAHLLK